jgi:hypothetical protein
MTSADTIERDDVSVATAPVRHPHRPKRFLSRSAQARRYGVSKRTIERWGRKPQLNMPVEFWLNGMPHRDEAELEQWEAERRGKRVIGSRI